LLDFITYELYFFDKYLPSDSMTMRSDTFTRRDFLIRSALTAGVLVAPGLCGKSIAQVALEGTDNNRTDVF